MQRSSQHPPVHNLPFQLALKRSLDLAVAFSLLLLTAPAWIVVSICIRATSPGPALFRQVRIGRHGKEFVLFKFRTMILGSDDIHREYTRQWIQAGEGARQQNGEFKIADDERITPIGRFLRKYSLDELPQLLNVVRGEMSMVGPRPALSYEVQNYAPSQLERFVTLPGITGLWQVSGRNQLSFERMLELDLEYIHAWSIKHDLAILLRTIPIVLRGTGH
jgi:lipopolysaccharide/colanic/teichoic acid biosynthesis glycosyltransferase